MIAVGNFVGALMQAMTAGRAMSDQTSAKVADQYLGHEYLRAFPVPRMSLKTVDVDVNFAVGATSRLNSHLKHPEVSANIVHRFRELAQDLPSREDFRSHFGRTPFKQEEWKKAVDDLAKRVEAILADPPADIETLQHVLTLATENFFYGVHHSRPQAGLLSGLRDLFGGGKAADAEPSALARTDALRAWAGDKVGGILDSSVPGGLGGADDTPELQVLIGGKELESQSADRLQKAKLTFYSEDRKWVAAEKDGKKTFILDR